MNIYVAYIHGKYLGRLLEQKMFQTNAVEKTKTHTLSSILSFPKNRA
jgi:hypothetical protein